MITGSDYVMMLPGGETFDISLHSDWDEISAQQQYYISAYIENHRQRTLAAFKTGVSVGKLKEWVDNDKAFAGLINFVDAVFVEGLRSIHFMDAVRNSKIRGAVLKAENAEGYREEKKTTNHLHQTLVVNGMKEALALLEGRAGFNQPAPQNS